MRNPVARTAGAAALLVLAAACGGGSRRAAQPAPPVRTGPPPTPVAAPPIFGLFGEREELGLTSEQIDRLETIATGLRERNDSLERELRDGDRYRGRPQNMREQQRRLNEALPTLEQVWTNNRRAMDEVGQVLTQPQRDRVCARQRERAAEREGAAPAREMERQPMNATEANAIMSRSIRGWTWCPIGGGRTQPVPAAMGTPATPSPTPAPRPTPTPAPTPTPSPTPTPTPAPSPTPTPAAGR